jgi:hypothetical protein
MRARITLLAILVLVVSLGCVYPAAAQITVAQLNGTVHDESGGSVARATVSLREMDTNRVYTTSTGDSGFYVLPNLAPGRYELKVSFTGFSNYTQTGFVLTVGQSATVDVTLKVATKGEQVVVTGEAPVIEPSPDQRPPLHRFRPAHPRRSHRSHQLAIHHHRIRSHPRLLRRHARPKQ